MTGFKNIVATLYLKNGQAVKSASDMTVMGDVYNLCQLYNDSGIDKIIILIFQLMMMSMRKHTYDRKYQQKYRHKGVRRRQYQPHRGREKLLYAGCLQVIFNATKDSSLELANVASEKFGKDKILCQSAM